MADVGQRNAWRMPSWLRDCLLFGFGAGLFLALILAPVAGSWLAVLFVFLVSGLFLTGVMAGLVLASEGTGAQEPSRK